VRPLDSDAWRALPETDGARSPMWSPDSRYLGFVADNKLRKIDVLGGPPQTIANGAARFGGSWSVDGSIVFNQTGNGPLVRVSASGGEPTPVTTLASGEVRHSDPHFLPDGRHFVYGSFPSTVFVGSLTSNDRTPLLRDVAPRTVFSKGRLFFVRAGTLMAQRFDPDRLALEGDPSPVAEIAEASFDVTSGGLLVFKSGEPRPERLEWFDRNGKSLGALGDTADYYTVELSSAGSRAAGSIIRASDRGSFLGDVWIHDVASKKATRLTFDPTNTVGRSVWSPDDRQIVFMKRSRDVFDLYQKASDGAGDEQILLEDGVNKYPLSWSRDGRFLLYMAAPGSPTTASDLLVLPLFGDRKPFPYLQTTFAETAGQFSPDGRWIAYYSGASGQPEVHVASFPTPTHKRQISTGGQGGWPRWRGDGKEIYWLLGDNMMAAAVNGEGTTFEVGAIQTLFKVNRTPEGDNPFAVSPDGQRFLVITTVGPAVPSATLITNVDARIEAVERARR
jgi:Tol biopolymer transport system component